MIKDDIFLNGVGKQYVILQDDRYVPVKFGVRDFPEVFTVNQNASVRWIVQTDVSLYIWPSDRAGFHPAHNGN